MYNHINEMSCPLGKLKEENHLPALQPLSYHEGCCG